MKILFVSFSNVGDAVLSLPALERVIERYPKADIDVVCGPRAVIVFEKDKRIRRILTSDRRQKWGEKIDFFLKLRKERYDRVIDLKRNRSQALGRQHKRDAHLAALKPFGIPAGPAFAALPPSRPARHPLIVIAPGSRSHIKQWPAASFRTLADRLASNGAQIVWIGDAAERKLIEEIRAGMKSPGKNTAGETDWHQTVSLIQSADLVITNDSAPLHAADHAGRKVLCFFGPTDPAKYGPQRSPEGVLFRQKFCSPCESARCRYNMECMSQITPDEAYKRASAMLAGTALPAAKRFLIVRLDRLGDLLLSLPALAALRRAHPAARVTALVRPYTQPIADRAAEIDDVISYDYRRGGAQRSLKGYFRLVRELRKRRFDAAFILHPTFRSHLLCFLAGIPVRIGYAARGGALLTRSIPDRRHEGAQHESRNVMDVIAAFGAAPIEAYPQISIFQEDENEPAALLEEAGASIHAPYVVFHAGSSSRSKEWPAGHFIELGRLLKKEFGHPIVLVGDAGHAALNESIRTGIGEGALNLSGKTRLTCLAALLRRSRLLVTNDSGPAHVGAASGARVISIFGRNQPGLSSVRWRPLGERARVLQKDPGCAVCLADDCPIGFECLKMLTPEDVLKEVRKVLAPVSAVMAA